MRHCYIEFNGQPYKFQGDLDLGGQFLDFILTYGDEALQAMQHLESDPEQSKLLQELLDQGLLEKVKGRFFLTPRAANLMQRKALMEVFAQLKKGTRDGHASPDAGGQGERLEGSRRYEFGDPLSEIDLVTTLRQALTRQARGEDQSTQRKQVLPAGRHAGCHADPGAPGSACLRPARPLLRLRDEDIAVYNSESRASCSTVVLLDMSGSMQRFGRFVQAKKCAMTLMALVQQRFPLDTVDLIGFHSGADLIQADKLPLLMPKRVTLFDPSVRLRVPLDKIDQAPQHFTNLHLGLMKARRLLTRRGGDNKMVFIVTDGQPTAHVQSDKQGDAVYLIYPPAEASHVATLKEALVLSSKGVRICTFALTDDYWDMDWLGFVEQLGRLTRGVTFQCASGDLTMCVMESYLSGRRRKTFIA